MADAVDAHEAAQAPPTSKASCPPSMPAVSIDDTPTEPATSPRTREVPFPRYVEELRLPTREMGPHEEPERFATKRMVNDGSYTDEEFDALLRKARQAFNNRDMGLETEDAVRREREAYERSVKQWERRIAAREIPDHRDIHVVHLQQELHLCVYFLMSMQHFVRMIPPWLHIHNKSSRRLHRLQEDRRHQASIPTRKERQLQSGMVNRFLDSWQRRFSMIYQ